jgi:Zn-dependent peptidase ImmA (M78 family)
MVKLELVEFADFRSPPEFVSGIFRQNPDLGFPVPLEDIARAAGIFKIRYEKFDAFEGVLRANAEKSRGIIAINSRSWPQRQRFTLGHELGHFLLPKHNCFMECSANDMMSRLRLNPIEVEANEFSAQLLMPESLFTSHPDYPESPDCRALVSLADCCDVSFKACAYRYQDLFRHPLGLIFSQYGEVRSIRRNEALGFWIKVGINEALPNHLCSKIQAMIANSVYRQESATDLWFDTSRATNPPDSVMEETFLQENGYATTLLWFE